MVQGAVIDHSAQHIFFLSPHCCRWWNVGEMLVRIWFRSTFSFVAQLAQQWIKGARRPKSLRALAEEELRSAAKWMPNGRTESRTDRRANPSFVIVVTLFGSKRAATHQHLRNGNCIYTANLSAVQLSSTWHKVQHNAPTQLGK